MVSYPGQELARKVFVENNRRYVIIVHSGLHFIKGNRQPHFGITSEVWQATALGVKYGRDMVEGGSNHDRILHFFPQFKPLVDMHLSDMDGSPMYSYENGKFWLFQAHPTLWPAHKLHSFARDDQPNFKKYRRVLAEHLRISPRACDALIRRCIEAFNRGSDVSIAARMDPNPDTTEAWVEIADPEVVLYWVTDPDIQRRILKVRKEQAEVVMLTYVKRQRPRWHREALEVIDSFKLVVYGDMWEGGKNSD